MGAKRYSTEQIIVKLRQAEIEMGRGMKVPEVCRKLGIAEQTFYRWRKRYGGLDRSEPEAGRALVAPGGPQGPDTPAEAPPSVA